MKTTIQLMILFMTTGIFAQSFTLEPTGFKDAVYFDHDYLVIESPGTQAELYKKTLAYLHTVYKNPDAALSSLENQSITVNGYAPNSIHRNGMHVFDMDYTLVFRFKDGKVRVDAPSVALSTYTDKKQVLHIQWTKTSLTGAHLGIYGKKDKLKSERAKTELEQYFNTYLEQYQSYLKNDTSDNDW